MQSELNELKAQHHDEVSSLRDELDDTVEEFSTLSYNSRVVCVSYCIYFNCKTVFVLLLKNAVKFWWLCTKKIFLILVVRYLVWYQWLSRICFNSGLWSLNDDITLGHCAVCSCHTVQQFRSHYLYSSLPSHFIRFCPFLQWHLRRHSAEFSTRLWQLICAASYSAWSALAAICSCWLKAPRTATQLISVANIHVFSLTLFQWY